MKDHSVHTCRQQSRNRFSNHKNSKSQDIQNILKSDSAVNSGNSNNYPMQYMLGERYPVRVSETTGPVTGDIVTVNTSSGTRASDTGSQSFGKSGTGSAPHIGENNPSNNIKAASVTDPIPSNYIMVNKVQGQFMLDTRSKKRDQLEVGTGVSDIGSFFTSNASPGPVFCTTSKEIRSNIGTASAIYPVPSNCSVINKIRHESPLDTCTNIKGNHLEVSGDQTVVRGQSSATGPSDNGHGQSNVAQSRAQLNRTASTPVTKSFPETGAQVSSHATGEQSVSRHSRSRNSEIVEPSSAHSFVRAEALSYTVKSSAPKSPTTWDVA